MTLPCGYLDSTEIQVIMSLLKVIDNPSNDIALVTVLRSMIGGFDDNELIEIRVGNTKKSFYESMCEYCVKQEKIEELSIKIQKFLRQIQEFRKAEEYMPLHEFIWKIYLDTGYSSYVSLMPNGNLRAANLKLLFEKAKQYEKTSLKGLYQFIRFIDKLTFSSGDMAGAKLIGENEDVVRIMSIHKSKGLEFPVVFLSATAKKFNLQDLNKDAILLHQNLGFGPQYINFEEGETYTTLAREAVKLKTKLENIAEEMRVLYVALTRAKEKLIITGVEKDAKKSLTQKEEILDAYCQIDSTRKISSNVLQKYRSYLDWIELVYLKRKKEIEDTIDFTICQKQELLKELLEETIQEKTNIEEKLKKVEQEKLKKIKEKLEWSYRYSFPKNMLTKSSVSKIKNMAVDEEKQYQITYEIPEFLKEKTKLTGAEKGSLMHLLLQKLDPKVEYRKKTIEELVERLQRQGIISQKQKEEIEIQKIYDFTKTRVWEELKTATVIEREKPFYMNVKANEIYEEGIEESILIQGVIDLYYITKQEEVVLVDYKTDRVKTKEELLAKYQKQLQLYQRALEKALGRKVDRTIIYSVYLNEEIKMFMKEKD